MNLKPDLISQLQKDFPKLKDVDLDPLVSENLVSPFHIQLPKSILEQIQKFIRAAYSLRQSGTYLKNHQDELAKLGIKDPGNKSMAMSYDFHVDPSGQIKLIEINTNASFLMLGLEMYKSRHLPLPVKDFSEESIREMILEELRLQNKNIQKPTVQIVDENPHEQRLYVEFLAYDQLFKSWDWSSKILDYRQALGSKKPDFIYNRHTDFFLSSPEAHALKAAFLDRSVCFSPNPFEYYLLADKERLIEWTQTGYLATMGLPTEQIEALQKGLPHSVSLSAENSADIWKDRKKYFLKPKRAFGSKQSFRGASISNKAFQELIGQDIIAQEFIPAPEVKFSAAGIEHSFKYDLRCYAYQDQLQLIVARLYQGQVTNLRTPLGGFTCVEII